MPGREGTGSPPLPSQNFPLSVATPPPPALGEGLLVGSHLDPSPSGSPATVSTGHFFTRCKAMFAAAARILQLLTVPRRRCSSHPKATELRRALKTSFSPTNHITIRLRRDIKFQIYGKNTVDLSVTAWT